jgi:hypothetical protein
MAWSRGGVNSRHCGGKPAVQAHQPRKQRLKPCAAPMPGKSFEALDEAASLRHAGHPFWCNRLEPKIRIFFVNLWNPYFP